MSSVRSLTEILTLHYVHEDPMPNLGPEINSSVRRTSSVVVEKYVRQIVSR